MILVIAINEGMQYHVGKLRFAGFKATTEDKLRAIDQDEGGHGLFTKGFEGRRQSYRGRLRRAAAMSISIFSPQGTPAGPGMIDITYNIQEGDALVC